MSDRFFDKHWDPTASESWKLDVGDALGGADAEMMKMHHSGFDFKADQLPPWRDFVSSNFFTFVLLALTLVYPLFRWGETQSVTTSLVVLAVAWIFYMAPVRLAQIIVSTPKHRWYGVLKGKVPRRLRQSNVGRVQIEGLDLHLDIKNLVTVVLRQIKVASSRDEVRSVIDDQIDQLIMRVDLRYAASLEHTKRIVQEGILGTFIAVIAALYEAKGVPSFEIISIAMITSVIGIVIKNYWEMVIRERKLSEVRQLESLRAWLHTNLVARLSLPAETHTTVEVDPAAFAEAIVQANAPVVELLLEIRDGARPDLALTTVMRADGPDDRGGK